MMLQESLIIQEFDPADRFIPQRSLMSPVHKEIPDSSNRQHSILKQDVSKDHLDAYKKHLEVALNVKSRNARLLKYSRRSLGFNMPPCEEYQWPTRCRKQPLLKKPYHLSDMPNFRADFFTNQLDWGPSDYLVAALQNTVYLYAVGYEPIQLTWFQRGICSAIKWNSTGDKVIIGTSYSIIEIWNTNTRKRDKRLACYCYNYDPCVINTLIWHPNNVWCASGCSHGRLHIIQLGTKFQQTLPLAHEGQICSLRSSADGRLLASAGEDGTVNVWDWRTMQMTLKITDYDTPIRAIAWHPWKASCLVIGGSNDGTISVWNVNTQSKEVQQLDPEACVYSLEFSAVTGELVASVCMRGSSQRSVILVMKNLDKVVDRVKCDAGRIYHMVWRSDGRELDSTKKCYDELGCLVTNRVWFHPENRPENPEPASRHTVKTQFVYYTRDSSSKNNTSKGQIVPARKEFIQDSGFKCEYPTVILIHDFTSHGWAGWIKHTIQGMMAIANWNVYSVDWESGARPPYAQAVSNARVVALEIIFLLKILQTDFNVDVKDVHIIGHGVGAHIAGYVGGNVQGLGKITALDPSGPYYHDMPSCTRLDIMDACIVQVIHTDTVYTKGESGQGIPEPLGHYDFYPNLGHTQPGCEENIEFPSLLKVTEDNVAPGHTLPGCSHKRAFKYMKEALLFPECPMMGFRCRSKEAFLNGQCTMCGENSVNCVPFHILNNKYPKPEPGTSYFFKTNSSSPFCLYPYNIALELMVTDQASDVLEGSVSIRLQEKKRIIDMDFVNTWPQKFEQGRMKMLLGYHPAPKLLEVDQCEVTWKGVSTMFHKASTVLSITSVYVTNLGSYPPSNVSTKLCSCNKDHTEISSGQSDVFIKCGMVPTLEIKTSFI